MAIAPQMAINPHMKKQLAEIAVPNAWIMSNMTQPSSSFLKERSPGLR
jgi:hypothetical protein